MKYFLILSLLVLAACNSSNKSISAQQIIDKSIAFSGVDKVASSVITFRFRDKSYKAIVFF